MADIIITIPNPQIARVVNAFAVKYGYQENVFQGEQLVPNPETKAEFAKARVIDYIKGVVLRVEKDEALRIAEAETITSVDAT